MKEATAKRTRRKYDETFRREAVKMVNNGQSVRSVAQSLGVAENLIHKWKKARNRVSTPEESEMVELRARLRQAEAERDVLKKAISIFSRQISS